MYISLEEAKAQVAIDEDVEAHDDRLERLIDASEAAATNFLNRPLSELVGSPDVGIPEDAKSGLLLLLEWEFDRNRQDSAMLLERAHQLLWPYRAELDV
jgi:hypothetical protein